MSVLEEMAESPLERISDGYFLLDAGWRFLYVNAAARRMLGWSCDELVGRSFWDAFPVAVGSIFEHQYRTAFESGRTIRFEAQFGPVSPRWYSIVAHPSKNELQVFFHDITERAQRQDALRRSERYLREMVENLPSGALLVDSDGALYINRMAETITGISRYDVKDLPSFFRTVGGWRAEGVRAIYERAKSAGFAEPVTMRLTRGDGTIRHVEVAAHAGDVGEIWILHDVTSRVQAERELRRAHARVAELADSDGLTGMLNRRAFDRHLQTETMRCQIARAPLGLLMVDVDDFKVYNDRHGHPAGDEVLRQIAAILRAGVRPGDLVARYGGEEFVVILPNGDAAGAEVVAERIRIGVENFAWPLSPITVSIGVASLEPDSLVPSELLLLADKSLYSSKARGRNRTTRLMKAA